MSKRSCSDCWCLVRHTLWCALCGCCSGQDNFQYIAAIFKNVRRPQVHHELGPANWTDGGRLRAR
eukprot:7444033-Alexandrium_andersonii.AAC.1